MSKASISLIAFSLALPLSENAVGSCEPFAVGEKTVLSLTYLGATAGTSEITVAGDPAHWKFSVLAKTDPVFSLFYRVQNLYEASVPRSAFLPDTMRATINESRQQGFTLQEFDRRRKKILFTDRRQHKKHGDVAANESFPLLPGTLDVVTALFAVRREPLSLGKELHLPVLIGREVSELSLVVEGEEALPTKIGEIDAWVLKAAIKKNGVSQAVPESQLWIAKKLPRQILKLKAKVKIGSVIAYLKSYFPGGDPGCGSTSEERIRASPASTNTSR